MDRQRLSNLAHRDHPIAAPLSEASVTQLLRHTLPSGDGARVLDLGCGAGAWLTRALAVQPKLQGVGVDSSPEALTRAREAAEAAGVADRCTLHQGEVAEFSSPHRYGLVLCVGATHAYGGLVPTLDALRDHLQPDGTALVGEGFWEQAPGPAALAALGADAADYADLAGTVDRVTAAGWTPVHGHTSSLAEWDNYEWAWTGSLSRWALDHRTDPDSAHALRAAATHRDGWLRGYRGTLGFVTLALRRTAH